MTLKPFSRTDTRKSAQQLTLPATAFLRSHTTIERDAASIAATPATFNVNPVLSAVSLTPAEGNSAALTIGFNAGWADRQGQCLWPQSRW